MPDISASKPSTGDDCAMIERFALRNALRDVEHHNVAELTQSDEVGERTADLAGADQCNLGTRHEEMNLYVRTDWASPPKPASPRHDARGEGRGTAAGRWLSCPAIGDKLAKGERRMVQPHC